MVTFSELWQMLYDHGSSNYYKYDCNQIWDSLTADEQQALYDRLDWKIKSKRYVDYNPLEAIHDNLPRKHSVPLAPPMNYMGKALPRGRTYYKADYRGQRGLYTEEDVKAHRMSNAELFMRQ